VRKNSEHEAAEEASFYPLQTEARSWYLPYLFSVDKWGKTAVSPSDLTFLYFVLILHTQKTYVTKVYKTTKHA